MINNSTMTKAPLLSIHFLCSYTFEKEAVIANGVSQSNKPYATSYARYNGLKPERGAQKTNTE